MKRSAGILLPVFSLPSPYGIGSLGKEARAFADFLHDAGQTWWQILPVGPTGGGDSPYTSSSTFAGNPLFIDLESLAEDGLLTKEDLKEAEVPQGGRVDYGTVRKTHSALLRRAFSHITPELAEKVRAFRNEHPWVREYAMYQALHDKYDSRAWWDWPEDGLRRHDRAAIDRIQTDVEPETAYHAWEQYTFFQQWRALKKYVNSLGIGIIGDLPIYVSLDSADVWSERKQFQLDEAGRPKKVAGVPPDYFSTEGQLWGNPLYDWDVMKKDGFGWWIRRVEGAVALFDAIRIDHFRGLESYWAVPAGAKTAKEGAWEKGPGLDLVKVLTSWFHDTTYIAEDLGILTDAVHELRDAAGLPGMKVLEFAFSDPNNAYLPQHYVRNCICYTGTHDNDTAVGWYEAARPEEKAFADKYLGLSGDDPQAARKALLRLGQGSVANLFVAQMQDYLGLDGSARINVPGVVGGNWGWRMAPDALTEELAEEVRDLTETYSRCDMRPKADKADKKAAKEAEKAAKKSDKAAEKSGKK